MDFGKLNQKWILWLTVSVFVRNFPTYVLIAVGYALTGIAQSTLSVMAIGVLPLTVYLGAVSFMIVHKTIVTGKGVPMADAFALTPAFRTYFWQYLFIISAPFLVVFFGTIALLFGDNPDINLEYAFPILLGVSYFIYYLILAFVGTSLPATALKADGMMMISRGKLTFWYSLLRLLFLPMVVLAIFITGLYFLFDYLGHGSAYFPMVEILQAAEETEMLGIALISAIEMVLLFLNVIFAVVVTKAFILAEARLAVLGRATPWGRKNFGMVSQQRPVVYR